MAGEKRSKSGGRELSSSLSANALELRNANQSEFQSVVFRSLKGRELIIHLKGAPPQFGDVVELRNPGPEGVENVVKAEVVGLEKGVNESEGIRVVLGLTVDAPEAIASLFSTAPRSTRPRSKLADSPIFSGFDEDESKSRRKKKSKTVELGEKDASPSSSSSPTTLSSQDSGELSWGWVARDEEAFAAGDIRATPVGDIDIDALSKALATAQVEHGSDIYTRATDAWSPLPEAIAGLEARSPEDSDFASIDIDLSSEELSPENTVEVDNDRQPADLPEGANEVGGNTPALIETSAIPQPPEDDDRSSPRPGASASEAGRYIAVRPPEAESFQEDVYKKPPPQKTPPQRTPSKEAESLKSQRRLDGTTGGYLYTSEKPVVRRRTRSKSPPGSERSRATDRPLPKPTAKELSRGKVEPGRSLKKELPERSKSKTRGGQRSRDSKRASESADLGEAPVVGIDVGASYSKVAVYNEGRIVLIEDSNSSSATRASVPSTVAFSPDGKWIIGEEAREMLWVDPSRVITSAKRLLGLKYSDPQSSGILSSLSVPSYPGSGDSIVFDANGEAATVEDIVSHVVKHLVEMASTWAGNEVTRAVVTVPIDFDEDAKRELRSAALKSGIEVVAVISEPVAAAMGCGFSGERDSILAVFDFGGGTCDTAIVKVANDRFSILGSAGDRWLGGAEFDELLAQFVAEEFFAESGVSFDSRPDLHQRLLFTCEESKRWLSTLGSVDVILPRATMSEDGPVTLRVLVERSGFEELIGGVVDASIKVCEDALKAAEVSLGDVDGLLLTGGTTRVPAVRRAVQDFFGKRGMFCVYPEHAVVVGAAINAAMISGAEVPRGFVESLSGGKGRVSRQIGLALADGSSEPVIEASESPPVAAHRLFCTSQDNQTACRIELVEGSSNETEENRKLGGFIIDGLPPRMAGETKLDIYFELSSTGTLFVTAQDRSSGHRAQGIFDIPVE